MKQILITRPEPDASETAARVEALGFAPVVAPIFRVCVKPDLLPTAAGIAATVLTSRNAISACPPALHGLPAFAVGPATANRARQAGFATVINADGNADALAARVTRELSPSAGTIFLPAGKGQGTQLAARLRQDEFHVLRRIAYEVERLPSLPPPARDSLRSRQVTTALFFSTESASHFVRLIIAAGLTDAITDAEAVSISERPIMALRRLPWRRISVAAKPNQDAMLALLS